jgi:aryl-alcohol dehydrogenase-like predicted oxidoreductase
VLAALDEIAAAHGVEVASVAIAWLLTRPGVVAPLASARTVDQLGPLLVAATLKLTADEVHALDHASVEA